MDRMDENQLHRHCELLLLLVVGDFAAALQTLCITLLNPTSHARAPCVASTVHRIKVPKSGLSVQATESETCRRTRCAHPQ